VRWSRGGERFVHATPDATGFVRELFAQYGDEVADLKVRRASLEDTYMAMVHRQERAHPEVVSVR
jgi:ABC-2 type transport system ATP-binding protein